MDAPATALVVGGGSDLSTDLLCRLVPRGLRAVLLAGPRQPSLDAAARRLRDAGVEFDMIVSHGNAIGMYFFDPDHNRLSLNGPV